MRSRRARPGQLVIARHPAQPEMLLVKRLIRRTADGWYLLSANPVVAAVDSRRFGPVAALEGRVLLRYRRAPHPPLPGAR